MAVPAEAIQPGSTAYGDRQTLEQGLAQVGGGAGGGAPGGAPAPGVPPVSSPIQAMLGGTIQPPDQPITSGLSAGPGPGPEQATDPMNLPGAERWKLILEQTTSPTLRKVALMKLRQIHRRTQ